MTFKHKLSRRLAMLKDALLVAGIAACQADAGPGGPADAAAARIEISPPTLTIGTGRSTLISAVALSSSNDTLPGPIVFSVTGGSLSDTSSTDNGRHRGRFRAGSDTGKVKIIARHPREDVADTTDVTVSPVAVASLTVAPESTSMAVGASVQLTATPRDSAGNVLADRAVVWASGNPGVASVTAVGVVTGLAPGTTIVRATSEDVVGTAFVAVTAPSQGGTLAVFPGAEGFGTTTPAGRKGAVWRVTNLNDNGPGSLRAALAATGPRVVVFEVAGTITLAEEIAIASPYLTVAGQTAPSPGVTLRGAGLRITTHDVLIQHLRIRVGDDPGGVSPGNRDGLQILGSGAYNVVVDHVSASWGIDEVASAYSGPRDITISSSIMSEGLSNSLHPEGEHSKGLLIGQTTRRIAVLRSLFAHNRDRNPYQKGGTTVLFVNNVVYNWGGSRAFTIDDWEATGPDSTTIVGNVYLRGMDSETGRPIKIHSTTPATSQIYVADNTLDRAPAPPDAWTLVTNDAAASVIAAQPPVWSAPLSVLPAGSVEAWVLGRAGARPRDRDAVDARLMGDVATGGGRIIDSPAQVGGWPSLGVVTRPLTLPPDPNGDDDGDGYTNLEEWLHALAAQLES